MIPPTEFSADRVVLDAVGVALSGMPADARIAIAYSGGLDSTVLLDAAVRVAGASRCVALHVHHGLSANADAWVAHAEASAVALGVAFESMRVDVPRDSIVAFTGVAMASVYMLRLFIRTMHNRKGPRMESRELRLADGLVIAPLVLAILAFAFYPQVALTRSERSVKASVAATQGAGSGLALTARAHGSQVAVGSAP